MSKYGRNFEFRVPPTAEQAKGRFYLDGVSLTQGVPVVPSGNVSGELSLAQGVSLKTGATVAPKSGKGGILVFEPTQAFKGLDSALVTNSSIDMVPSGKLVKVVSGPSVKVCFTNTAARSFMGTAIPGRTMVAGMGATPTVAVGDYLTPGTGSDGAGYWAETATVAEAWLVVTAVDAANGLVEAQFTF